MSPRYRAEMLDQSLVGAASIRPSAVDYRYWAVTDGEHPMASKILILGAFALASICFSSASFAAGKNHITTSTLGKAAPGHEARRKKCLAGFDAASAHVKAAGKQAYMAQCMKQ
jgi:hypothetical protein